MKTWKLEKKWMLIPLMMIMGVGSAEAQEAKDAVKGRDCPDIVENYFAKLNKPDAKSLFQIVDIKGADNQPTYIRSALTIFVITERPTSRPHSKDPEYSEPAVQHGCDTVELTSDHHGLKGQDTYKITSFTKNSVTLVHTASLLNGTPLEPSHKETSFTVIGPNRIEILDDLTWWSFDTLQASCPELDISPIPGIKLVRVATFDDETKNGSAYYPHMEAFMASAIAESIGGNGQCNPVSPASNRQHKRNGPRPGAPSDPGSSTGHRHSDGSSTGHRTGTNIDQRTNITTDEETSTQPQ